MGMMQTQFSIDPKEDQKFRLARLKEAIDAEQLLQALGFTVTRSNSREVRCACKVHGGDNKSAFRMNKETKNWVCYSHGCQDDIGYDVFSLVMHVLNFTFAEAVKYLETMAGVNVYDEASYLEYKKARDRKKFIEMMTDNRQVPSALVSEEYLKSFRKFRSDFFEKEKNGGFTKEVLDLFEVGGGYVDRYGFQRDVVPIRDVNGVLKAYSCRDITGQADEDYKYILTRNFEKDTVLYNLNRAKDDLDESRTIIVVEGFKSVWRLYMAGYKNVVACMGSRITPGQQNLLYSYAFNLILLFDMDAAGMKGMKHALADMDGKIRMTPLFLPYVDADPADLSVEEIKELLGGNHE
jgi:DNA primase